MHPANRSRLLIAASAGAKNSGVRRLVSGALWQLHPLDKNRGILILLAVAKVRHHLYAPAQRALQHAADGGSLHRDRASASRGSC